MTTIIGRGKEKAYLDGINCSDKAQFVAVYGRRRVGKTYLVRTYFESKGPYLEVVGVKDGSMGKQLEGFHESLIETFPDLGGTAYPADWKQAFSTLDSRLQKLSASKRFTVFLDELPWLASPRSCLLQELDYFWNKKWSKMPTLNLVVCGSAASWMTSNLINDKGGLHNRLTGIVALEPFSLCESRDFLQSKGCDLTMYQIIELYLAMGGVPYYLEQASKGKSPAQIIEASCFDESGLLRGEFDRLFPSLFAHSGNHMRIIRMIARKRYGASRKDLILSTGLSSGGSINRPLEELEASGFITRFVPYGKKNNDSYFRLSDEFTNFHLSWIAKHQKSGPRQQKNYWLNTSQTPSWKSWAGYGFEGIVQKHADRILDGLGVSGVLCEIATWRCPPSLVTAGKGAQIDLLLDRADGVITIVEIKFSAGPITITSEYADKLRRKQAVFVEGTKTRKSTSLVMVSPFGVNRNKYSNELLSHDLSAEVLFRPSRQT